jgi:hypothetical protein
MRPPQPACKAEEIKEMQKLLLNVGLEVISNTEIEKALSKL